MQKNISNNKNHSFKTISNSNGFTLVEMSIVLIILGLALVSLLSLYNNHMKNKEIVETRSNLSIATQSMNDFRARYGRYPCPASLTSQRGDDDYGREGDCNENALHLDLQNPGVDLAGDEEPANIGSAGTFANGYYVEQSARIIDIDGDLVPDNLRIVRGSIPFRDLNLPEHTTYDGYHSRLSYAVTQNLAVQDLFNPQHGGISVVDNQVPPQILLNEDHSGLFVVFSHGPNKRGAYNSQGNLIEACDASIVDGENCDASAAQSRFIHAARTDANTNAHYDDLLSFYGGADDSLWEISEEDEDDIILRQDGNVGINIKLDDGDLPDGSLSVIGIIRSGGEDGQVKTQSICDKNGNNCFEPEFIGGNINDGTGGFKCPSGQFLVGISGGAMRCENDVEIRCPNNSILTGVNNDGTLICEAPPVFCSEEIKDICGENLTLDQSRAGDTITLTAGASRDERFVCRDNGEWRRYYTSGVCSCSPDTYRHDIGCGNGFDGTRSYSRSRVCPAGYWGSRVYDSPFNVDCQCVGYTRERTRSCGAGFNEGEIRQVRNYTCPSPNASTLQDSGWITLPDDEQLDPCRCEGETIVETGLSCTGGLQGEYTRTNIFSCPAGTWGGYTYDYSACYCDEVTRTRIENCPDGEIGSITEKDTFICENASSGYWPNNWQEISNDCAAPPPTVCTWEPIGTPVPVMTRPNVSRAGSECGCGSATSSCFEYGDPNFLKYNMCKCQ